MDGSGASSGEGCLGRHLHCFLLVFAPLLPESAPQFDAGIAKFCLSPPLRQLLPSDFLRLPLLSQGFLKSGMTTAFTASCADLMGCKCNMVM